MKASIPDPKEPKVETGCIVLGIIVVLFWFFVGAIIYAAF
jgi:hypothetical protein